MFRTSRLFLVVLLLLTCAPVLAYTSPGQPDGFVNDYADILTEEQEDIVEARLSALATSEGSEVAIVTITDLGGDTVENVAVGIFNEWGIGKKELDNGLLLLVAVEEREMRIEVGYGLEGTITDAQSYWILTDVITPSFKNADYYTGISSAVDALTEAIAGDVVLPSLEELQIEQTDNGAGILAIVWAIFVSLAAFFGRTKSFWLGGVVGLITGAAIGVYMSSFLTGFIAALALGFIGLIFDYFVSRGSGPGSGMGGGMFRGGGSFGGGGGFGGGSSGGGGASGRW